MKTVAIDVGFSDVKAQNGKRVKIPSVVGAPMDETSEGLRGNKGELAVRFDQHKPFIPVGKTALLQSKYTAGSRDPGWVLDTEWHTLFAAAIGEMFKHDPFLKIGVVTGLPVADWEDLQKPLKERLNGFRFSLQMKGRAFQDVEIVECKVATQPIGTLADLALDDNGNPVNNSWATGRVLIIDIGGLTMNMQACENMGAIHQFSESFEFGLLKTLDSIARDIRSATRRFNINAHEVAQAMASGSFRYHGRDEDIRRYAQKHLDNYLVDAVNKINEVQTEAGRFDAVALTGGGAAAVGEALKERLKGDYANVTVVEEPEWANVRGYYKLAKRLWR